MRVPNICLVLKLDNGKVVSKAHEQNHPGPHSNIDFEKISLCVTITRVTVKVFRVKTRQNIKRLIYTIV